MTSTITEIFDDIQVHNPLLKYDPRNVQDHLKGLTTEAIRDIVQSSNMGFSIAMSHHMRDYNFGSVLRNCNGLGVKEVFYIGPKKWDRRSALGVYHYTKMTNFPNFAEFMFHVLGTNYDIVVLENNVEFLSNSFVQNLITFEWPSNPLIVLGEEGRGTPQAELEIYASAGASFVEIPMYGSVRSYNAASAACMASYDFVIKKLNNS